MYLLKQHKNVCIITLNTVKAKETILTTSLRSLGEDPEFDSRAFPFLFYMNQILGRDTELL